MNVRERVLAIRLSEKLKGNPSFAERVGVEIAFKKVRSTDGFKKNLSK